MRIDRLNNISVRAGSLLKPLTNDIPKPMTLFMRHHFLVNVDIDYFIFKKDLLYPLINRKVLIETNILPSAIIKNKLGSYVLDAQYYKEYWFF